MLEIIFAAVCFVLSMVIFLDATDKYVAERKKTNKKFLISGLLAILCVMFMNVAFI